jgi:tricorn protease
MTSARLLFALLIAVPLSAQTPEALVVRYPHQHGDRIVFTYYGDIWITEAAGANPRRLTVHPAREQYPRFSPDGRRVAFSSNRQGNYDVYVVPADGGVPTQLTVHSADDHVLGWTPDGRRILFASNRGEDFLDVLYTVSVDGGQPERAGPDLGLWGAFSPDGRRLAFNRQSQAYWRKHYRGPRRADVFVMDLPAGRVRALTEHEGLDAWPMWAPDGFIYFVSDRDEGGQSNIWRVPENGGSAERVTAFTHGDVRWPALGTDGRSIMFERDFRMWRLDLATREARAVPVHIATEPAHLLNVVRTFESELDDYDLSPDGRRIALSVHGTLFTAPAREGDLVRLTGGPSRDRSPLHAPDGRTIAFVSDASGREEVWLVAADGSDAPRQVSDLDALKSGLAWSPDSRLLAWTAADFRLRVLETESGRTRELAASPFGPIGSPVFSPDGRWIAVTMSDHVRTPSVYLVPVAGGEPRRVTFDVYAESDPKFSADGRKLYFIRSDGFGFGQQTTRQIYAVALEREERDPTDPAAADEPGDDGEERRPGRRVSPPAAGVQVDFSGFERRTRQVTRMPNGVTGYVPGVDGRALVFATRETDGARTVSSLYTITDDGRGVRRVGRPGGGGPPATDFVMASDGRTLYFREGRQVYATGLTADAQRRRITFSAPVSIDYPAQWAQMFDEAWRTMKYRFYDPDMHGRDWEGQHARYRPLVAHVGDRQELLNLMNEMIGELDASHTGVAPGGSGDDDGETTRAATVHLGVELEADERAGRYRVSHVYKDGPADKDWVRVAEGDYLLAIDGRPVGAGDNYWRLLNQRLNRRVEAAFGRRPDGQGAVTSRIEPASQAAYRQLRYERWVTERREMTERLSGGRVGYLHIQAMNQPSLRRFEKELREHRNREALVIDQRWNGGGNIEQELLAILVQREYQIWRPRGTEPAPRPFAGFFGPKAVLQNWRSSSNAEMFPAGFRALGLGPVIGTPTAGAVIGTGSYTLIDGATIRTPGVGVYIAADGTNMENNPVPPDILVEETVEDRLAGRDPQLERAVRELLQMIGTTGGRPN